MRRNGIWNRIGLDAGRDPLDYVRISLEAARNAAPHASLYIDDFGGADMGPKSDQIFELVSRLKAENVPIDGVGLECHYHIGSDGPFFPVPPAEEIAANMKRLRDIGLETMITSVDIAIRDDNVSPATLEGQARGYRALMQACLSSSGCKAFSTWGIGDSDSWILQAIQAGAHPSCSIRTRRRSPRTPQ